MVAARPPGRSGRPHLRASRAVVAVVCALAVAALAAPTVRADGPVAGGVAVIASEAGGRFDEVVDGLLTGLAEDGRTTVSVVTRLPGDDEAGRAAVAAALARGPAVVVTLGHRATAEVVAQAPTQPLVAGMIVDASDLAAATDATAVLLGHPLDAQLRMLRRVLPECATVGIIHDARFPQPARAAEVAAAALGLHIEARPIYAPRELPRAMASLSNSICALLGVPDAMVLSHHSAREVLLFSFRNRIPFVGPSETWVDAGALYALDWRYRPLGRQLAALVARASTGEAPRSIARQWPTAARLVVNEATAARLGVTVPSAVLQEADRAR